MKFLSKMFKKIKNTINNLLKTENKIEIIELTELNIKNHNLSFESIEMLSSEHSIDMLSSEQSSQSSLLEYTNNLDHYSLSSENVEFSYFTHNYFKPKTFNKYFTIHEKKQYFNGKNYTIY